MIKYEDIKLWDHQKEAIAKAKLYLENANSKSFLLKLPTGAGKTGIFCVLSRVLFSEKNFLIIVPSIALKQQVFNELTKDFWKKAGTDETDLAPKEIHTFTPAEFEDIRNKIDGKPHILICVVNTIHSLKSESTDFYNYLKANIDVVIFDEGHKEPAFSWALAVRNLSKKTLLFTATPFRNDLKFFNADKEEFYFYSHFDAINNNVIRDVKFKDIKFTGDVKKDVFEIIRTAKAEQKTFEKEKEPLTPKVIIRCDDKDTIEIIVKELNKNKVVAIGIHEEFSNKSSLFKEVPNNDLLDKCDFIVHQFKLTEGIDYPAFLILYVVDDYKNDRSLVQQIGRITRNGTLLPRPAAIVYTNNRSKYESIWENYKHYDNNVVEYKRLYDLSDFYTINKKIQWIYFNGEFKAVSNKDQIDETKLKVPTRVSVKLNVDKLAYETLKLSVENDIGKFDIMPFKSVDLNNNGYLIFFEIFTNSPYLTEEIYIENKLGFLLFYLIEDKIYFFSTDNILPKCIADLPNTNYDVLLNALNDSKRLTRINLINSDIGRNSVRSFNLSSYSLEKSPIGLMDHGQVATLTEGFITNGSARARRYVGLSKSKVSDYGSDYLNVSDYYKWLVSLNQVFKTKTFKSNYLRRFAQVINSPDSTVPAHILIDIDDDIRDEFKVGGVHKFLIYDSSQEVKKSHFTLRVFYNNKEVFVSCEIEFDRKTSKYKIRSTQKDLVIYNPLTKENLFSYLNRNQPVRIVTEGNKSFYAFGNFYSPKIDLLGRKTDLDILSVFSSIPELEFIDSEKGDNKTLKPSASCWHKNTLFGIVGKSGNKIVGFKDYFDFDYLVCDDLNKENADFIGINNRKDLKRIVLVHAKAGSTRFSASAFQEVCGQAVKNLDLLSPFYEKAPISNFKKWDGAWKNSKIGSIKSRIIRGKKNGKQIWDLYQELLVHPDTKKEVCILTGALFCKADLQKEFSKKKIEDVKPEAIQLIYLIRTTWSSVSSVGASLKIFCY